MQAFQINPIMPCNLGVHMGRFGSVSCLTQNQTNHHRFQFFGTRTEPNQSDSVRIGSVRFQGSKWIGFGSTCYYFHSKKITKNINSNKRNKVFNIKKNSQTRKENCLKVPTISNTVNDSNISDVTIQ